ncbi:MAG TPA: molybdopterin molybdotransferase MoeA [Methanocella sp.]|nr:molybdopterin molybdotransferase MoeA [Methanocella sp.]
MPAATKSDKLAGLEEALNIFLSNVPQVDRSSTLELEYVDNRVLAKGFVAPQDYPHYDRCFMDGYAVRAEDTVSSHPGSPEAFLRIATGDTVGAGECRQVHTGSALPSGADAVVKVEDTEAVAGGIRIFYQAKPGENFTPKGKLIRQGELIFREGMQLKPTNIALIASMGITEIEVYERPRVLIVPTGDELVARGKKAGPGTINESNGLMCSLLVKRYGGKPAMWDIVPDNLEKLTEAVKAGLRYDLIITTGGTSVGKRDLMPQIVALMGRIVVHGVGIRPGRPVGMGYVEGEGHRTPIVFLPGFPDACAVGAMFFVERAIRKLGRYPPMRYPTDRAVISGDGLAPNRTRSITKVMLNDRAASIVPTVGSAAYEGEAAYIVTSSGEGYRAGDAVELIFLE